MKNVIFSRPLKVLLTSFSIAAVIGISVGVGVATVADETPERTRYEAEDSEIISGIAKGKVEDSPADYGSYSGLGFVGCLDYDSSCCIFTVNAEQDGCYELVVSYATDNRATFNVFWNDEYFCSLSLTEAKGWGAFADTAPVVGKINLNKGENKVKVGKGLNFAELDYIEIGARLGDKTEPEEQDVSEISEVPEGFKRYEAEKEKNNGTIYKTGTFSGEGYVGDLDFSGVSQIEFNITAPEDGEYDFRLAYAIGLGFGEASFKIATKYGVYDTIKCDVAFGWGYFSVDAIAKGKISLKQGNNSIIVSKSTEFAQIDFIDISNSKTGPWKENNIIVSYPNQLEGYTRYEAENGFIINAERKGVGFLYDFGHYSGYGYVGCLDNDNYYVEIPVNVEQEGEYKLRYCYASPETNSSMKFYAGRHGRGEKFYFFGENFHEFACDDWGDFRVESIKETTISLRAGENFIIIRGGLVPAEIDYIEIGERIGDYKDGVFEESLYKNNPAF